MARPRRTPGAASRAPFPLLGLRRGICEVSPLQVPAASPPSPGGGRKKSPKPQEPNSKVVLGINAPNCKEKSLEWGLVVRPLGSTLCCRAFVSEGASGGGTPVGSSSAIPLNHDRRIA